MTSPTAAFTEITVNPARRTDSTEAVIGYCARPADSALYIRAFGGRGAERRPTVLLSASARAQLRAALAGTSETWTDIAVQSTKLSDAGARLSVRRRGSGAAIALTFRGERGGERREEVSMANAAREQLITLLDTPTET